MKKVSILYSPGTNCEEETSEAFRLAGARPELVFLGDILAGKKRMADCDAFCVPGGFSFGDHIATGAVVATLAEDFFPQLLEAGTPTIGICNGFQILARARMFGPGVTLGRNGSRVFCSKPTVHRVLPSNSFWTAGLEGLDLSFPSAHGYGRVVSESGLNVAMIYMGESPNGGRIAGICSENGRVFGLMDHPERRPENEDGQLILKNVLKA